jgi:hypothetical protein
MSRAEVVGLMSDIINILDSITELYSGIKDAQYLPQSFLEASNKLSLVQGTLQIAKRHITEHNPGGEPCRAMELTLQKCKGRAELLRNILKEVALETDALRIYRYSLAVRKFGKESRVEELVKGMLDDMLVLAQNPAIKAASETQGGKLRQAIEELSALPPSLPEGEGSPIFLHSGTGHQFNNTGQGTQNINPGSGRLFISGDMQFHGNG